MSTNRRIVAVFEWTEQRSLAAIELAKGGTQKQVAQEVEAGERTIRDWLANPEFAAEVDRLSLMVDVASRAERLRIAMRAVRQKVRDDDVDTDKDVLDWLKFAQSETDGVKLDLSKLAALTEANASLADRGPARKATGGEGGTEPRDQGSAESSGPRME